MVNVRGKKFLNMKIKKQRKNNRKIVQTVLYNLQC
jgi:hypothetical protein